MLKYAAMNAVFLAIVFALFAWKRPVSLRSLLPLLAGMVVLTAVFDSLIIGLDIVRYYEQSISGYYIGLAPIEDFAYTIAAVTLVPVIWTMQKGKQ